MVLCPEYTHPLSPRHQSPTSVRTQGRLAVAHVLHLHHRIEPTTSASVLPCPSLLPCQTTLPRHYAACWRFPTERAVPEPAASTRGAVGDAGEHCRPQSPQSASGLSQPACLSFETRAPGPCHCGELSTPNSISCQSDSPWGAAVPQAGLYAAGAAAHPAAQPGRRLSATACRTRTSRDGSG